MITHVILGYGFYYEGLVLSDCSDLGDRSSFYMPHADLLALLTSLSLTSLSVTKLHFTQNG